MKNKISLLSVLFFTSVLVANAQIKQISSADFYRANNNAYNLMSERPRRIVVKTENFENGAVTISRTTTDEKISSDKSRYLIVEKKGGEETTLETIYIGTKIYRRKNNEQWTVSEMANGSGSGFGSTSSNCNQYTEEQSFNDGISTKKLVNLELSESKDGLTFDNFTVWYDNQGFFHRAERVRGLLEPRIEQSRSVTTYEYEPKDLKIEAPIK